MDIIIGPVGSLREGLLSPKDSFECFVMLKGHSNQIENWCQAKLAKRGSRRLKTSSNDEDHSLHEFKKFQADVQMKTFSCCGGKEPAITFQS